MNPMNTTNQTATTTPSGAPTISRYLQRKAARLARKHNPSARAMAARRETIARRCSGQSDNTRAKFAESFAGTTVSASPNPTA